MHIKRFIELLGIVSLLVTTVISQPTSPNQVKEMPTASFVLHYDEVAERTKVALGPMHRDEKGQTSGTFTVYGGSSMVQVSSVAMDRQGNLLAVGSTPNRVDLWDVQNKKLLRSFPGGTMVALSSDGNTLISDGNGIQVWDAQTGNLRRRIERTGGFIRQLVLDASAKRLLLSANGEDDAVFDLATGTRLATLTNTQWGQFSQDGLTVIGGNSKQLIVWDASTWKVVKTLPNGPDYVTRMAVSPDQTLIVVGGPKAARLLRADNGETIARLGDGYTNFASFTSDSRFILTYPSSGFVISNSVGKPICGRKDIGNGHVTLSGDDRWLASAAVGGRDVMVWSMEEVFRLCGGE